MELLRFENVSFRYPEATTDVLKNISFSMQEGEFTVLCGQSGCGKSTLLHHVKKNQIPFGQGSGRMFYCEENIEEMDELKNAMQIGFVGQNPDNQMVTDKVWHELAFGLENLGITTSEIQNRVAEMAQYFGISEWFHKKVNELSGGQKQILNLASVMVMKPKLLVLDEPTSQLDPIGAKKFIQTLISLNDEFGTAILISEQRLEEVLPVADQVMIMHEGELLGKVPVGKTYALLEDYREKSGEILPVQGAMPVAMRAWMAVPKEDELVCPLNVKEGKQWLKKQLEKKLSGKVRNPEKVIKQDFYYEENEKKTKKKQEKDSYETKSMIRAKRIEAGYVKHHPVLHDFAIDIPQKSIYALLGGNGSGKTTALKVLAGILKPQRGSIKRMGKTGYLPQNPESMFTEVSVEEELAEMFVQYGQGQKKEDWESVQKKIEEMLSFMELTEEKKKNPFDLSGGQKQRLALAKVLLTEPDILLLDEPTKGLDARMKEKLSEKLKELQKEGMTMVMVSHDMEFCSENATHCGMLFDGQILQNSTVRQFFLENTFYTTPARRLAAGILDHCIHCQDLIQSLGGDGDV